MRAITLFVTLSITSFVKFSSKSQIRYRNVKDRFPAHDSFSKKSILKLYASHAPYGGNIVGLEAASWRYFGLPANKLSWAESATLAVLPNAPALIYPGKNQKILVAKRNKLLQKLNEKGILDNESYPLAL